MVGGFDATWVADSENDFSLKTEVETIKLDGIVYANPCDLSDFITKETVEKKGWVVLSEDEYDELDCCGSEDSRFLRIEREDHVVERHLNAVELEKKHDCREDDL